MKQLPVLLHGATRAFGLEETKRTLWTPKNIDKDFIFPQHQIFNWQCSLTNCYLCCKPLLFAVQLEGKNFRNSRKVCKPLGCASLISKFSEFFQHPACKPIKKYGLLLKYGNASWQVLDAEKYPNSQDLMKFKKTIFPFIFVGHEMNYSQLGATWLVEYSASHIQLME